MIQPNDLQEEEGAQVCSSDEEETIDRPADTIVVPVPKKRGRPRKDTAENAKKSKKN